MGTTDSKVENEIAIVNIQEALARHEDSKSQKYMGEAGPTIGMQHVSFHTDTMVVILLASTAVLMFLYLTYNCLKRGKLCPRGLTDVLNHQSDIRYRGRLRYRRGDEEEPRLTPLMMYPGGVYPCPAVANVGQMAAGIEIPAGCPSAPDQPKMRQFSHVRPGGSEGGFV